MVRRMAKYIEIYQDLAGKIQDGTYAADSYLPSENELMGIYGASRDTVRKALTKLEEKDLIHKEKGKGSRVLDVSIITFPMSGLTSFKELAQNSQDEIVTDVIDCTTAPSRTGARRLGLPDNKPVTRVERVRSYNGERVILDLDYINPDVVPGITADIAANSLYEYIEEDLKLPISFAKKEVTVEPVTARQRRLLDMGDYDLLVVVRSSAYLEDATLFEYTESRHRPDKFKFLDFAKREKL